LAAKVDRLESELEEKSNRIKNLESEVDQLQTELATVRSERDRLEATLIERGFEQEPSQEDREEDQSPLDKARRVLSFGE
jgi:putative DNA primase/helicase